MNQPKPTCYFDLLPHEVVEVIFTFIERAKFKEVLNELLNCVKYSLTSDYTIISVKTKKNMSWQFYLHNYSMNCKKHRYNCCQCPNFMTMIGVYCNAENFERRYYLKYMLDANFCNENCKKIIMCVNEIITLPETPPEYGGVPYDLLKWTVDKAVGDEYPVEVV